MLLTLTVLLLWSMIATFLAFDLHKKLREARESVEGFQMELESERREHDATKERVVEQHKAEETLTAQEIVARRPQRLKLKRSLSELSQIEEWKHQEKQREHDKLVRNIEQVRLHI